MGAIVMESPGNPGDPRFDDQLLGPGNCGTPKASDVASGTQNGRCGYGPRQPLVVVSPWAKRNYVDHTVTDQSSILRFVEDNWNLGRIGGGSVDAIAGTLNGLFHFDDKGRAAPTLILDPAPGQIVDSDSEYPSLRGWWYLKLTLSKRRPFETQIK